MNEDPTEKYENVTDVQCRDNIKAPNIQQIDTNSTSIMDKGLSPPSVRSVTSDFDLEWDDMMLKKLLRKFQMTFLFQTLKGSDITYRSLRYLSVDDINTAIRSVGQRAEFREKLFNWRRRRYRTNDIVIAVEKNNQSGRSENVPTMQAKASQTEENEDDTMAGISIDPLCTAETTTKTKTAEGTIKLNKMKNPPPKKMNNNSIKVKAKHRLDDLLNLENVIDESLFGVAMKHFYKLNGFLERKHRDELIQIIVDHLTKNNIKLHCCDFVKITDMISNVFPSEEYSKDYYFISRRGKRNPMGRLYTKYYNTLKRLKIRQTRLQRQQQDINQYPYDDASQESGVAATTLKLLEDTNDTNTWDNELIESHNNELTDFSEVAIAKILTLKELLGSDDLDWEHVKVLWTKTYMNRQKDIENEEIKIVMERWPKYLTERGIDLFNIDFNLKFNRSNNMLQEKWPKFQHKICHYYQENIKDEVCKSLYFLYKSKPGKDYEDYILITLLNSIILPAARYRDVNGNRRKICIADAMNMFALRVSNLNELESKRQNFLTRYGDLKQNTVGPNIIVIGESDTRFSEIYIQFYVALYEMPSFLTAVDCCLKIYRVLNIEYPPANENVWSFIQRHFYELNLNNDIKSPLISALLSFFKY